MINCPACNTLVQEDAAFCNSCGKDLRKSNNFVSKNVESNNSFEISAMTWLKFTYIAHIIGIIFPLGHLVGIILTMLKKSESKGDTFITDHYSYTFNTAVKGAIGFGICMVIWVVGSIVLIGPLIGGALMFCIWVWTIVKYVKGWMKFDNSQPINA